MAKVKSFRAESGVSFEVKGLWYKLYCAIELDLDESDDVAEVKRKAWNTVNNEIEMQTKEILEG